MKKFFLYNAFTNIMPEMVVWMIFLSYSGWSLTEIAIIQGVYTFSSAIFEIPSGIIADKIGKKLALQIGEVLCIIYLLGYFFADYHYIVFICFILFALGISLISGTDISLLYSETNNQDINFMKYIGYFNSIAIFSVAIGQLMGGMLASISWTLLFSLALIFRLLSFYFITSMKITDEKVIDTNVKGHIVDMYTYIKQNKYFKYLLVSLSFLIAATTLHYQYIPIVLNTIHFSTQQISIVFFTLSLLGALGSFFYGSISDRMNMNNIAIVFYFFIILSFALLTFINHIFIIVLIIVIPHVIFELLYIIIETYMQDILIDHIRVSSTSLVRFISAIGLTLGSLIIAYGSNKVNIFVLVSVICCAYILISLWGYYRFKKKMN